ncbi:MAG: hypothetical protein RIC19_23285 [Phaeodactylibacter sp.]|uniref:hypothetical protein n=1 Tax=Phaeodactylibacter sp. TaxID=1940289 RepID=UPI0032EC601C
MMNRLLSTLMAMIGLSIIGIAQDKQTIFDALHSPEILEVNIETDLSNLIDNRKKDEYQYAIFSFENAAGELEQHDMKLKPRGKFRRNICDFPPIKLNFSKDRLMERNYIAEYDKLKLVTHCIDDKYASKENVAREYLAYRLYNLISDKSYRVQLVRINYIDSKDRVSRIKRYGFILEDTDEMAHRAGGKECEACINVPANELSLNDEHTMAVFQYMIGNADYNTGMMRNVKMVRPYTGTGVIPVPYDFDFAGFVNPSYAIPNSDYGLVSVKQRVFLGNKVDSAVLSSTLQHFLDQRSAMEETIDDFKLLDRQNRTEITRYLDTFFKEAEQILSGSPMRETLQQQALKAPGKGTSEVRR